MHLPYLRKMLGDKFKLVPIMVGATDLKMQSDYADILLPYFEDKDSLFVISSDFCHWGSRFEYQYYNKEDGLPWQSIEKLDGMGMNHIQEHDPAAFDKYIKETKNTICGRHPIGIYLNLLKKSKLGLKTKFVKYAQSEQVKSSKQSSVSYASAISFIPSWLNIITRTINQRDFSRTFSISRRCTATKNVKNYIILIVTCKNKASPATFPNGLVGYLPISV